MRVSKKRLNPRIKKQIKNLLYQVLADVKSPEEVRDFLEEALSETELEMLAKRLAVAHYLDRGRSYENIKNNLAISSATVATIAEQVKKGQGFKIALKKIQAEEWADKWAKKISKMMSKRRK
jgi:uncharacterized protein YerC